MIPNGYPNMMYPSQKIKLFALGLTIYKLINRNQYYPFKLLLHCHDRNIYYHDEKGDKVKNSEDTDDDVFMCNC